jgi:3D (Asp-Asp-Asp) domain-containing protein
LLKVKKRMIRAYMFLGVCSISMGTNYSNIGHEKVQINKFVASKYHASSKVENVKSKEYIESADKNANISSEVVDEAAVETKEAEMTKEKSKEDKKSITTTIKAELTAYCDDPRCSDQWGAQTAMQTRTRLGVIAAPSNVPLGSKMYIPELVNYKEDGMFDVEDRGGAIKIKNDGTYVIDVWVPTYEEAMEFGRKKTTIYLVG